MPIRSDGEETRSRILNAAGEAFGKNGFDKVTNKDISVMSGANTAAVSYYFRDKAGLYRETWQWLCEHSLERYTAWLSDGEEIGQQDRESSMARFKRICRSLFDWMHDQTSWDSEIWRFEMTLGTGLLDDPAGCSVASVLRQALKEQLASLLDFKEGDPRLSLSSQMIVASFRSLFQNDREEIAWDADETFEWLYQSFLGALGLSPSRSSSKNVRRSNNVDDSHPELGVTDEVDPFILKPVTREDLLMMKKAESDDQGKTSARSEPDRTALEPDDNQFLQPELW